MTDLRIVCTYDALKTAEALRRLLEAEEHKVVILYGRQSLAELPKVRAAKHYVLLIWSYEAPTTQYMLDWASQIDPSHLIEIARTPDFPAMAGRAPVIAFDDWNGERGGRAWNALHQRVKNIADAPPPKKPPPVRAAVALAIVSLAAIVGAVFLRAHDAPKLAPTPEAEPDQITAQIDDLETPAEPGDGVGGPLEATEPPSVEYLYEVAPAPSMHMPTITLTPHVDLSVPDLDPNAKLRDLTFFERLAEFNPLRRANPPPQTPQN